MLRKSPILAKSVRMGRPTSKAKSAASRDQLHGAMNWKSNEILEGLLGL